jgi:protein-disulfide isomerase
MGTTDTIRPAAGTHMRGHDPEPDLVKPSHNEQGATCPMNSVQSAASTDRDHSLGRSSAPVNLVQYGDFGCAHCVRAYPLILGVIRYMGESMRYTYRNFSLNAPGKHGLLGAEACEAAGVQGRFWEMHDQLFRNPNALREKDVVARATAMGLDTEKFARDLLSREVAQRIRDDFRGGIWCGVKATPTFFINGLRYDGNWLDAPELIQVLRDAAYSQLALR